MIMEWNRMERCRVLKEVWELHETRKKKRFLKSVFDMRI